MTGYRGWIGILAGAAALSLAVMAPGTAVASGSHHLIRYKVEKHVTMEGDFQSVDLACSAGDYAVDGMWRIDHVDQDNEFAGNVLTTVDVYDSYGDATNPALWHFTFAKDSPGDAQLKVFLMCLGSTSAPNTHQHGWTISPRLQSGPNTVPAGTPTTIPTPAPTCAPGYLLVAPGFHITHDPLGDVNNPLRLVGNYPIGVYPSHRQNTWQWRFLGTDANTVDVMWRCLRIRSDAGTTGHTHKLVYRMKWADVEIAKGIRQEKKIECAEHYKGMVGGFWFGPANEAYLWYLGMDPRPKERAWSFLNLDPDNAHRVDLSLLCFNDRTS